MQKATTPEVNLGVKALLLSRVFPYYRVIRKNGRVDVYAYEFRWVFTGSYWL